MKVYVASHSQELAKEARTVLTEAGHSVTSRWLDKPFNRTETFSESERQCIADENETDIENSDVLVLISGPERYPGGKFIEAGYARGLKKNVVVVGRRENMQTWATGFYFCQSIQDVPSMLGSFIKNQKDSGCPVCGL